MRTYRVTEYRRAGSIDCIVYTDGGTDPEGTQETQFPAGMLSALMAEYGLDDPATALDWALHGFHVTRYLATLDPRDDPAAAAGWVTDTGPDAEPIVLFNARSTRDAAGANQARIDATKQNHSVITDPDGLLAPLIARPVDDVLLDTHEQDTDVLRWRLVYGDLPDETPPRPDSDPTDGIPLTPALGD